MAENFGRFAGRLNVSMFTGLMNLFTPTALRINLGPFIAGAETAVRQMILAGQPLLERLERNINHHIGIGRNRELIAGDLQIFAAFCPFNKFVNEILFPGSEHPAQPQDQAIGPALAEHAVLRRACFYRIRSADSPDLPHCTGRSP